MIFQSIIGLYKNVQTACCQNSHIYFQRSGICIQSFPVQWWLQLLNFCTTRRSAKNCYFILLNLPTTRKRSMSSIRTSSLKQTGLSSSSVTIILCMTLIGEWWSSLPRTMREDMSHNPSWYTWLFWGPPPIVQGTVYYEGLYQSSNYALCNSL